MNGSKRSQNRYWTLDSLAVIFAAAAAAMTIGRFTIAPKELVAALIPGSFPGIQVSGQVRTVISNIRFPKMTLAPLSGAGLAVVGAAFQGLFANPLATPGILGAADGTSSRTALGILLGLPTFGIRALAMTTGVAAVLMAWSVVQVRGTTLPLMVILAGMVVSSLFSALVSLVKYTADPQDILPSITHWLMGNMASIIRTTPIMEAPFILAGSLLLFLLRWKLNIMSLPEDEAESPGIPTKRIRSLAILGVAMVTVAVISIYGQIGWIGLFIPYVVRIIFGNDSRSVVPVSMTSGALSMFIIDTAARSVMATKIPVSILTSLTGTPCFMLLFRKTGGIRL